MGRSRHVLRVLVHTDHTEPTWTAVMRIWRHLETSWCQASSARAVAKAGFGCWTWIFAAAITEQYMAEQGNMCAIATFMTWNLYRELETIETNNDHLPYQQCHSASSRNGPWPIAHCYKPISGAGTFQGATESKKLNPLNQPFRPSVQRCARPS